MDKKNILKIIILILAIVILVFAGIFIYNKVLTNKFKKILRENDSTNYILTKKDGKNVTTVKFYGKTYIS